MKISTSLRPTCLALALLFSACSGGGWVHPAKPQEEYSNDYNRCETQTLRDPKLQQGSRYLLVQAIERCLLKEGWRVADK